MQSLDKQKKIEGLDNISTPSLLLFPDIVKNNIDKAIKIAGDTARLRPHVKTHKLPQIVQMHLDKGINKFKCSTLAEMNMVAEAGANDLLLAYPAFGPLLNEIAVMMKKWPAKKFALLCDNKTSFNAIKSIATDADLTFNVFLDIDNGMGRTGISPGVDALRLYEEMTRSACIHAAGLHIYDGHIRQSDFEERKQVVATAFEPVLELKNEIEELGFEIPEMVCGGTPTFPIHSLYEDRILSPGTYTLWDFGYGDRFQELDFGYAALLATRVISKPGIDRICLDLGHKAVASEKPQPRIRLLGVDDFETMSHSEEHLVLRTREAEKLDTGTVLLAVPVHICPTVALYDQCYVVNQDRIDSIWSIVARRRIIELNG